MLVPQSLPDTKRHTNVQEMLPWLTFLIGFLPPPDFVLRAATADTLLGDLQLSGLKHCETNVHRQSEICIHTENICISRCLYQF